MNERIVVVVSSCDAFHDCWEPFGTGLAECWPDCNYRIVLICNKICDNGKYRFELFRTGEDFGWAGNLKKLLETLDCKYILYLQEDYWLTHPVRTSLVEQYVQHMEDKNVDYLRLTFPEYNKGRIKDTVFCSVPSGVRYRLCLQAAIWKRETLLKLLCETWSGWDFERKTEDFIRDNHMEINAEVLHHSCRPDASIEYVDGTGVRKGRWTRAGAKYLRDKGFQPLIKERKIEGRFLSACMHCRIPILSFVCRVIVRIMNEYHWNF